MKTRSEELLAKLARKTFLSLWAYPNVFRKTAKDSVPNKEICDLLVVFENDIVIFSDKEIAFPQLEKIENSWARWYNKAIRNSAKQLFGARRMLMECGAEVFLDERCETPLPVSLPDRENARIHLVVVARGASDACVKHHGGSGTLAIEKLASDLKIPFFAPQPFPEKGCVHVFDERSLEIVIEHLDTTKDFVGFLRSFEDVIFCKTNYLITGIEEMLADYIRTTSQSGYRFSDNIQGTGNDVIVVEEGFWFDFQRTEDYEIWQNENYASTVWDDFIERVISSNCDDVMDEHSAVGQSVRLFASTTRLERRVIAGAVRQLLTDERLSDPTINRRMLIKYGQDDSKAITLLCYTDPANMDSDERQILRSNLLHTQMIRCLCIDQSLEEVGGLAFSPPGSSRFSENFSYIHRKTLSNEEIDLANDLALIVDIYQKPKGKRYRQRNFEREAPLPVSKIRDKFDRRANFKSIGRNGLCPCGNGKKFKHCCWDKFMR